MFSEKEAHTGLCTQLVASREGAGAVLRTASLIENTYTHEQRDEEGREKRIGLNLHSKGIVYRKEPVTSLGNYIHDVSLNGFSVLCKT